MVSVEGDGHPLAGLVVSPSRRPLAAAVRSGRPGGRGGESAPAATEPGCPGHHGSVTDVHTAPASPQLDEGDHDRMAHIVYPKEKLTEALVTGTPVIALCGKVWTPSRDPERYPVCQGCIETFEAVMGRSWPGRR